VPHFFPLETVVTPVTGLLKHFDLPPNRNVTAAGQNVLAVRTAANGVLQVSMADPWLERIHGDFRALVRRREGMECIPEQTDMWGIRTLQHFFQHTGGGEVIVRFEQD